MSHLSVCEHCALQFRSTQSLTPENSPVGHADFGWKAISSMLLLVCVGEVDLELWLSLPFGCVTDFMQKRPEYPPLQRLEACVLRMFHHFSLYLAYCVFKKETFKKPLKRPKPYIWFSECAVFCLHLYASALLRWVPGTHLFQWSLLSWRALTLLNPFHYRMCKWIKKTSELSSENKMNDKQHC